MNSYGNTNPVPEHEPGVFREELTASIVFVSAKINSIHNNIDIHLHRTYSFSCGDFNPCLN
jgi:hypothetical protein